MPAGFGNPRKQIWRRISINADKLNSSWVLPVLNCAILLLHEKGIMRHRKS